MLLERLLEFWPVSKMAEIKPWYRSTKKMTGIIFLANGLGMSWFSFFQQNPNDPVAIIGMLLGTGITLLGIKTAGGVMAAKFGL